MSASLALLIGGCATTSSVPNVADSSLPQISNLKTMSGTTEVGLEWPSFADNNAIKGFYIYRGELNGSEMKLIKTIKDKYATHYVDTKLAPESSYKYMIKAFSDNGVAEQGGVAVVNTTKLMDSVPYAQVIHGLPERIKLVWRPHPDLRVNSYVIERRKQGASSWKVVDEVKGRLNAEFIDRVGSGETYEYRIFVKTANGELSKPSEVLIATTKELPAGVNGVMATNDKPKKITISWNGIVNDEFAKYKVYSSRAEFLPFTLLGETTTNSYDDYINDDGATRYYKVTMVDVTGLESLKQDEAVQGSTLQAPKAPNLTVSAGKKSASLSWDNADLRAVKYRVEKSTVLGLFEEQSYEVNMNSMTDNDVESGKTYYYRVYSIDEYGLNSKASNQVSVEVK